MKEVEWADHTLWLNGVKVAKIVEFNYVPAQEKEELYAAGNDPHGIQRGNRSYRGYMVLLKTAVDAINRAVQLAGGKDLLDANFVLVHEYKQSFDRPIQTETFLGVEFTEAARSLIQNAKSMPVRLPWIATDMKST